MNPEAELARRTRRSFLTGGIAAAVGFAGVRWLGSGPLEQDRPAGLRRTLENNEKVAKTYFKNTHLSTEYPKSAARMPKSNGDEGLGDDLDASAWRLILDGQAIPIEDIQRLPRVEHVTEL